MFTMIASDEDVQLRQFEQRADIENINYMIAGGRSCFSGD